MNLLPLHHPGDNRLLHSFPTRRSSDLVGAVVYVKMERALLLSQLPSGLFARLPERKEAARSEEHTSELQPPYDLVCRLLLEKKKHIPHPAKTPVCTQPSLIVDEAEPNR